MAVLHTVAVKATNPGGRLFDGIDQNNARKNGEFGFLGDYAGAGQGLPTGQTQVKVFGAPTQVNNAQPNHGRMPVIIMQPEMMYDNSRKSLLKLANMEIKAQTPFTCIPLEEGDKIQASIEILNPASHGQNDHLAVGQCYVLTNNQTYLTRTGAGTAPVEGGTVYFEIVKVKDAHARSARIGGAFRNDNYKLYTFEVKVVRA